MRMMLGGAIFLMGMVVRFPQFVNGVLIGAGLTLLVIGIVRDR